jgi:hypothetical protein
VSAPRRAQTEAIEPGSSARGAVVEDVDDRKIIDASFKIHVFVAMTYQTMVLSWKYVCTAQ